MASQVSQALGVSTQLPPRFSQKLGHAPCTEGEELRLLGYPSECVPRSGNLFLAVAQVEQAAAWKALAPEVYAEVTGVGVSNWQSQFDDGEEEQRTRGLVSWREPKSLHARLW